MDNVAVDDPLFTRKFIRNPSLGHGFSENHEKQFSVVTYNILADCNSLKGKEWGSYTWLSREKLTCKARHKRLFQELMFLKPDIVCLQEVEESYYASALSKDMEQHGFKGVYVNRYPIEPWITEGEAIYYKTDVFALDDKKTPVLIDLTQEYLRKSHLSKDDQDAVAAALHESAAVILARLRHIPSGHTLALANTHVSWGWLKRPDTQSSQIAACIRELVAMAGNHEKPHLMCGDFNSTPDTPGYQMAQDKSLSEDNKQKLQQIRTVQLPDGKSTSAIEMWPEGFQHNSGVLRSASFTALGLEPQSSCFPHDNGMRAVDYIWFSHNNIDVIGVREPIDVKYMDTGMPNDVCPSDHMSLQAVFQFKE